MTDDEPLTPAQEQEVRRLLVDARHAEPMPGDVAARLDRVLAELARGGAGAPEPVTTLASRRRQRVTMLLVAAAAVVAIGIGLGQVIGTGTSGSSDQAGAGRSASRTGPGADSLTSGGPAKSRGNTPEAAPDPAPELGSREPAYVVKSPVKVRPEAFSTDVRRLRKLTRGQQDLTGTDAGRSAFDCTPADWGVGTFVPVTYAGDHGVLVFRRATGDTQVVDLFQCGSPVVLRSITLPAS